MMFVLHRCLSALTCVIIIGVATIHADEGAPANSKLLVDETFDNGALGELWKTNTGSWKAIEGVLRGNEIEADNHSAAIRRTVRTNNAVYQLKFRFVDQGKAFHFGFDPAKGEIEKRGHLFSVICTRSGWSIVKHVNKDKPKEEPNEVLARGTIKFANDQWHDLRVTCWGPYVTAKLDGDHTLQASDPSFAINKPTLVFRCTGNGVEMDDIKVWNQR